MSVLNLNNLNGNILCAVDVETTGRVVGWHEIIQIAIVPLTPEIVPRKDVRHFYTTIKPQYKERADVQSMEINGLDLDELEAYAPDSFAVQDMLEDWFKDLKLPFERAITPLAQNWPYEKSFLTEWLGLEALEHFFTFHARDTMATAIFLNDLAAFQGHTPPFSSVALRNLCEYFAVVNEVPHDALSDCLAEAEIYRRVLTSFVGS